MAHYLQCLLVMYTCIPCLAIRLPCSFAHQRKLELRMPVQSKHTHKKEPGTQVHNLEVNVLVGTYPLMHPIHRHSTIIQVPAPIDLACSH